MNPLIGLSIVINALVCLALGASGEYPAAVAYIMGAAVAISVIGAIVGATGSRKPGAILVFIGCVVFVPIGLIGVFGARKILDQLKQEAFDAGR